MSWGCSRCSKLLAKRWAGTFMLCDFEPTAFLTITLDPAKLERECRCGTCTAKHSPHLLEPWELDAFRVWGRQPNCLLLDYPAQHRWIGERLQQLYRRLRRRYGRLRYFRVYEFHRGLPDPKRKIRNHRIHVHLLVSTACPHGGFAPKQKARWRRPDLPSYEKTADILAEFARQAGFGRCEATGLISDDAAAAYATKYTCKRKSDCHRYRIRMCSCDRSIRHAQRPKDTAGIFAFLPYVGQGFLMASSVCDEILARQSHSRDVGLDFGTGKLSSSRSWILRSGFRPSPEQRARWVCAAPIWGPPLAVMPSKVSGELWNPPPAS